MKGARLSNFACLLLGALGLASGCATARPEPNERHGLFSDIVTRHSSSATRSSGRSTAQDREPSSDVLAAASRLKLYWPLHTVQVTSNFGRRSRDFHEGIDLKAHVGTPVYAAQEGKVIYAGARIRGYGNMVVIKHAYGLATVYAHNSHLLVHKGEQVKLGQKIAVSGNTGHSTGPHLHFEVRHGVSAVDPARLVPMTRVAWGERETLPGRNAGLRGARVADR